jgi:hypothetical protein
LTGGSSIGGQPGLHSKTLPDKKKEKCWLLWIGFKQRNLKLLQIWKSLYYSTRTHCGPSWEDPDVQMSFLVIVSIIYVCIYLFVFYFVDITLIMSWWSNSWFLSTNKDRDKKLYQYYYILPNMHLKKKITSAQGIRNKENNQLYLRTYLMKLYNYSYSFYQISICVCVISIISVMKWIVHMKNFWCLLKHDVFFQ